REECGVVSAVVEGLNWIGFDPPAQGTLVCGVQHRYGSPDVPARVHVDGERAEVCFERPEPSVTPGQGAAFYRGERLIGGGWIASTQRVGQAAPVTDGLARHS
ncbi:MAG: aminomethyltransferase beta-barrel domain-containing protein, partial [Planctomycetota bacterium]